MEEEFTLWLDKAKESLDDAVSSLENHRYGLSAFCSQQALEKLLKAAVVKLKNQRPRKIHDLADKSSHPKDSHGYFRSHFQGVSTSK